MSEVKPDKQKAIEGDGTSLEDQIVNGQVSVISNANDQKEFNSALDGNPNKVEGSIGEYLIALKPGMTLSQAEAAQNDLNQTKIESFGIVDDSGEIITARNFSKASPEKLLLARKEHKAFKPFIMDFGVTPNFLNQIINDVKAIPESHRNFLVNQGFEVELYKDIHAYDAKYGTTFSTDHPDGYPPGSTGENLDVFFDRKNKNIVALEFFKPKPGAPQAPSSILKTPGRLIHEVGHAFSMARNFDIERDPATMHLFENLRQKLKNSPITKNAIGYFSQEADKDKSGRMTEHFGLRETIAEFYASHYSTGADPRKHVEKSLFELYKPIWEIMKKKGYLI
ncbi:MAG: hypothetical protein SFY67_16465 [Candidatus Melainabacteria bacterium]|nr:hypothetical protein [Candidatus Melainabacteria bacterium]